MLKLFDYLEEVIATERISQLNTPRLLYTASEIMEELGYSNQSGMEQEPLDRAMHACASLNIPVDYNFKKVYYFKDGELKTDWQLSELATYLFMINCNPLNPFVAKAQLIFMMKDKV
ncbi:damage-inducible protein D [Chitinophaga silvatica]|uniref:Damage-inducible protein D n=1 Tax=Chitinophaga silvatica TaxID=2282649 RepID=A0A3E1YAU0_9BACT|nr:damage-inducible protein D [Chitinophaga silvatica]RFS22778.1 damage-inducible protein D [Chitinophaga silvatica]